jgi:hypothetical protein
VFVKTGVFPKKPSNNLSNIFFVKRRLDLI